MITELSQNLNPLEDSEEFETSENIDRSGVKFRVSKAWIEENNVDISTIVLERFHEESWTSFETTMTGEDEKYYFFEAETQDSSGMQL
ncbi:Cell surface protein [Methanosarcina sp. WWM596]|nr:Cell surface protein [Methanosarcina sp. WWM596]AKB21395.1 Cell surface protein [Methanosarcina sp. WH1]